MSDSIDYATPALFGRIHRLGVVKDTLGVLTLHRGRLNAQGGHDEMLFERDLADLTIEPRGHGDEPHMFSVTIADTGERWSCAFWWRNPHYSPHYRKTNVIDVPVEDVDLTSKYEAEYTCANWLRILADPTSPDPAAWHPNRNF